jgi:hypothetical protein
LIDGYIKSYNIRLFCLHHQKPLIGVRGRVQSDVELEDETHKKYVEVIAEKVTFLSSKRADE